MKRYWGFRNKEVKNEKNRYNNMLDECNWFLN